MPNRIAATAGAALAIALLGACSSGPQTPLASTATVTVDGHDAKIPVVKCGQLEWNRTIDIGGDFSGAKAVVDQSAHPFTVTSVHIQNVGGFTGMYSQGREGAGATASLNGDTFTIAGSANGFKTDKPGEPATADFKIIVTC
jgi:lipoprotein LpqH